MNTIEEYSFGVRLEGRGFGPSLPNHILKGERGDELSKSPRENKGNKVSYKIRVKTLEGHILTFSNITSYSFEGTFIKFIDTHTGQTKRFESSNTEIEEVLR